MDDEILTQGFKTKMRIVEALNELTGEVPFDQVRVIDICERVHLARSSFYHHFCDKNAILQWHSLTAYKAGVDETGRTLTWFEGHLVTTRALERFRNLYYRAGIGTEFSAVRPTFVRHRIETLIDTCKNWKHIEVTPLLDFQIHALACAEAASSNRRYSGELQMPAKEFCSYLETIVPRELYRALNEPTSPQKGNHGMLLNGTW